MLPVYLLGGVLLLLLAVLAVFFLRPASSNRLLSRDVALAGRGRWSAFARWQDKTADPASHASDTVFILPDISNYTRFMTGNRFAFGHARHIVFALIDAMVAAACKSVELSKLEGDAALFYVDAGKLTPEQLGKTVIAIMSAFFREQERLIKSNLCPCSACTHIGDLDIKVFVHRGQAARFEFHGLVDHFGTDVIIIHRLMKNSVGSHRYIMVTDAAAGAIALPGSLRADRVMETHEHIGEIGPRVYDLTGADIGELAGPAEVKREPFAEMMAKAAQNLGTLLHAARLRFTGKPYS